MRRLISTFPVEVNKRRLWKNFLSLSSLQAFNYILPLVTLPYLVRILGVEKFGLVSFAQSFIAIFLILVDYGFNLYATREISINRENKGKVTEIYSAVTTIRMALLILSFLMVAGIVAVIDKFAHDANIYYLSFLTVIGQAIFPIWYFQGVERMKYIAIINILSRLSFTLAIFLLVHHESDYWMVPALNGLGSCVAGISSLLIIRYVFNQKFELTTLRTLAVHFRSSTDFFLSRAAVNMYTAANTFFIGMFASNTQVGYYVIAEKMYQALKGLYGPVNNALYPYLAKEKNIGFFKNLFYALTALNLLMMAVVYACSEYLFLLIFEKVGVDEAFAVFHVLLVSNIIVMPSMLIGYPFLGALGFSKYVNSSVIVACIFHLFGLLFLVSTGGLSIQHVAGLVVLTEVLVFFQRALWIKRLKLW